MLPEEFIGRRARYRSYSIYSGKAHPPISDMEMGVLGWEEFDGKPHIWWQLACYEDGVIRYAFKLLVENLDFLLPNARKIKVARYLFAEKGQEPLEYVDASTGTALLPSFDFVDNLLPHASQEDAHFPLFHVGSYLGHPILLVDEGSGPTDMIPSARKLVLNPRLTIGTSRNFRNAKGGRMYLPGQPIPEDRPEYEWSKFTKTEYDELIQDVGMNIFTVDPEQREHVIDRPVFFISRLEGVGVPEVLYRSNYRGITMFMDEPAVIIRDVRDAKTPQEAANRLVEAIRRYANTTNRYGRMELDRALRDAGYDLGDLRIPQVFPVWETVTSAIWYEFKGGLNGFIHESRFQPDRFSELVKKTLGIQFPSTAEACIDFHYAWFRGAARHFGKPWGMAIYGQMDLDVAPLVFQRAYDQGAEFLWFWTSDHEHHVPYEEQKEHTRRLRAHESEQPRPSVRSLLRRAKIAIALPYGYLLDDWVMDHDCLWGNEEHLKLDGKNEYRTTYREVLAAAMGEAVSNLTDSRLFDMVYWGGGEKIKGYKEVHKVDEEGTITSCESC